MPFPRQNNELVGNVGKDAEMRYTPSGKPVTQCSMAVTRQWKQDGEDVKETMWVSITFWNKLAEFAAGLKKGQQILVKGYFKPDTTGSPRVWTRQDGTPGASFEFTASEYWLSPFSRGAGGSEGGAPEFAGAPGGDDDMDIPF